MKHSNFSWEKSSRGPSDRSASDISAVFMRDISKYPVPTGEEEKKYGQIIRSGVRRILGIAPGKLIPDVSFRNKESLLKLFHKREREAYHALVTGNLRLVLHIARRMPHGTVTMADRVGYGIEGLMVAALRFDPERNIRFSTYSTHWIRHHIRRAIQDRGSTIRTPVHAIEKRNAIFRDSMIFELQHGRLPTYEESAERLGMPPKKVEWLLANQVHIMSLNRAIMTDHGDVQFQDQMSDPEDILPDEEAESKSEAEALLRAMRTLSPRELTVLNLRFWDELTLRQTASHPAMCELQNRGRALSRERARQIQEEALAKLRVALGVSSQEDAGIPEPRRHGAPLRPKGFRYI